MLQTTPSKVPNGPTGSTVGTATRCWPAEAETSSSADNDTLNGASGSDAYTFADDWGSNTLTADASGSDSLSFTGKMPVVVDLEPLEGRAEPASGQGTLDFPSTVIIENAIGGDANDDTYGNDSQNDLAGCHRGDDVLYGDGANDDLIGCSGADYFDGGFDDIEIFAQDAEPDEISCGPGNYVAHYDPAPTTGVPTPSWMTPARPDRRAGDYSEFSLSDSQARLFFPPGADLRMVAG